MKAKYDGGAFVGYEPTGRSVATVAGGLDGITAMRDRMQGAFAPPTDDEMVMWLAELDLIVAPRRSSSDTDDLKLKAYLSRLRAYPSDVVHEALLVRTWRFFPTWHDLKEVCEEMVAHRRAVVEELDRAAQRIRDHQRRSQALPEPQRSPDQDAHDRKRRAAQLGAIIEQMTARVAAEQAADAELAAHHRYRQ